MKEYANNPHQCRSLQLIRYFGEKSNQQCTICDVCISRKSSSDNFTNTQLLIQLKQNLSGKHLQLTEFTEIINESLDENTTVSFLQWLIDNEKIKVDPKSQEVLWM